MNYYIARFVGALTSLTAKKTSTSGQPFGLVCLYTSRVYCLDAFAGNERFVDAIIAEMNSLSMNKINIFCYEKNNRILCPVGRAFVNSLV